MSGGSQGGNSMDPESPLCFPSRGPSRDVNSQGKAPPAPCTAPAVWEPGGEKPGIAEEGTVAIRALVRIGNCPFPGG